MTSVPKHAAVGRFGDHEPLSALNSLCLEGVSLDPFPDFQTRHHHRTLLETRAHHPWGHPCRRGTLGADLEAVVILISYSLPFRCLHLVNHWSEAGFINFWRSHSQIIVMSDSPKLN